MDYEMTRRQLVFLSFYPFTEPIMTPVTKYFCTKGYINKTGTTLTIMSAYLITAAIPEL